MIKDTVTRYMINRPGAGISLAIYSSGKTCYYHYGLADLCKNIPVTGKTILMVGSISKTFAGYLLTKAVEENKLKLNDDIRLYLKDDYPNPEYNGTPVKLYQLLNHSS